jgi:CMP-N,N'-diacetyllegionaminic acid synthase
LKVIGIIPARAGSKGVPGKNKKLLAGKPLIYYTLKAALYSKLDKIVLTTDDVDIMEMGIHMGVEVVKRPIELAQDHTPTLPVLRHVMEFQTEEFDAVMTLQPTSPLRRAFHINEAIELFKANPNSDSLVSVISVPHNMTPSSLMKLNGDLLENDLYGQSPILRRQDKPKLYARNGAAIYMTKTSKIHEFVFGGKIIPYFMKKIESIDIDNHEDWQLAELIINSNFFYNE